MQDLLTKLIDAINSDDIKTATKTANKIYYSGMDIITIYELIKDKVNISNRKLYILLSNI